MRFTNAIDTLAQGLELTAELLGTARSRSNRVRNKAKDVVRDLRDEAATTSDRQHSRLKRIHSAPSASTRALQFMFGFGAGIGVSLLFAHRSGKQMREKLLKAAMARHLQQQAASDRHEDANESTSA